MTHLKIFKKKSLDQKSKRIMLPVGAVSGRYIRSEKENENTSIQESLKKKTTKIYTEKWTERPGKNCTGGALRTEVAVSMGLAKKERLLG